MSEVKFYRCRHCGNLVAVVEDAGPVPVCCGEPMELLVAGSVDAAAEKHVPAVTREGNVLRARVGSVEHPMLPEHHIQWIAVACERRLRLARLDAGEKPEAAFHVPAGAPVTVYEYCNLHGLWKAEAEQHFSF